MSIFAKISLSKRLIEVGITTNHLKDRLKTKSNTPEVADGSMQNPEYGINPVIFS
ncbi:hypothetical protein XBP1_1250031 [Xenorhabdus bovienii str. puntauvense]|uniref:Uncharacterized protein n=3 Tax=Xenorhabdus bovienii TaxID=40576 RepID=A0A0B6XAJ3_XENBV|nr:hypothetical protein XBFFR1_860003 [Xenorhabdus bovienii str. feltiae France]CDG92244.1 hypothetical protein XBFFL1_2050003 [Xenorhabdus bovienii str. feltiae Florida]CDG95401.1 hypothetical protein XBP1_1250031 [Xenorhabdus bovienii str. puntauvense]CDH00992.1 hypothetical protein XBFM1_1940002 [Xenorhabdus bovienii str. feltiae Moldova]CDM89289.1 protein of unknown function [Xenorhabdus bovienii]